MRRSYLLVACGIFAAAAVFALRSSTASDEQATPAVKSADMAAVADLVERIETLEKRLTMLEGREPLVRQADSRELSSPYRTRKDAPPATLGDDDDEENEPQKTNGQSWKFRLLRLRHFKKE